MQIGDRVKDRISGFSGITTGRTEYINGCRQFLVKPEKVKDDGDKLDGIWIDEQTLEVVNPQVYADPFLRGAVPKVGGPDRRERAR
jgi:hypothetical protein